MNSGELAVGMAALAVIAGFVFWRFLLWVKNSPVHADPWDEATERAVQQPDAVPVCHHCLTQVPPGQWFCETCGCAVGPYNNLMPYLYVFSEGEILRNGLRDHVRVGLVTVLGYGLLSSGYVLGTLAVALSGSGFVPIICMLLLFPGFAYVIQLWRNFRRSNRWSEEPVTGTETGGR